MADKKALRLIGIVAASITGAVMLVAVLLVHKTVAGELSLDSRPTVAATR